jgi:TetR/AcrR family transcriptional regulator, cholesterol catabolism regulator
MSPGAAAPRPSSPVQRGPGRPAGGAEQGAATRERILRVAAELFAEKGFHATGVAEIGLRAGIQRGALYYHIGSKEELLWEVLRPHVEEARAAAQAIAQADLGPVEKLRRLIHDHVQTIATHRPSVVTYIRDRDGLSHSRRAELEALRDEVESAWRQILEEGVGAGAFRTADPVVVNGLLGLVNMVYLWYRPGGPDTPDDIAEKFTDLVTCGLLTEQARHAPVASR